MAITQALAPFRDLLGPAHNGIALHTQGLLGPVGDAPDRLPHYITAIRCAFSAKVLDQPSRTP
jgi:hypothetical protein